MKNKNKCRELKNVDFKTSTTLSSDYIERGMSKSSTSGFSLNTDLRFYLYPFYLDIDINSMYKNTNDEISVKAGVEISVNDDLHFDIFYQKRIYTDTNPDIDEIGVYSEYQVSNTGPLYNNTLSYDLNTNKYYNDFNLILGLSGFDFSLTYGKTNSGGADYVETGVSGSIGGLPAQGRLGKRITGDKNSYQVVQITTNGW